MLENLWGLCALFAALGAQESGAKHQNKVVENVPAARALIDKQAVAGFEDRMKDRYEIETSLLGTAKETQGKSAMWAAIYRNGSIWSFAGTRAGKKTRVETGTLAANDFVTTLTATSPDPDINKYSHRADFHVVVLPEIEIEVSLFGSGKRWTPREHRIRVEMTIEAKVSTDRNKEDAGWSDKRGRKIVVEAVVRLAKPGDPKASKVGDIFHDVTVTVDDVTRPKSDAYFLGEKGNAGGKVRFSERLKSDMRLRVAERDRYFLNLARLALQTKVEVTIDSSQAAAPSDFVECRADLVVWDAQVRDTDEWIGINFGESARQPLKSVRMPRKKVRAPAPAGGRMSW